MHVRSKGIDRVLLLLTSKVIMSNLLDFPPKKTYDLDLETPIQDFISAHGGGHPDEFKYDIKQWHSLRNNAVATVVHVDQIDVLSLWVPALQSACFSCQSVVMIPFRVCTVTMPN